MTGRFYAFQNFVGAWFHQDWKLDDPTPRAVAERFVEVSDAKEREDVVSDIDGLLELDMEDRTLHDLILREYDLSYDPDADEISMRDWLRLMRSVIAGAGATDA